MFRVYWVFAIEFPSGGKKYVVKSDPLAPAPDRRTENLSDLAELIRERVEGAESIALKFEPPYDFEWGGTYGKYGQHRCHPLTEAEIQEFLSTIDFPMKPI